MLCVHGTIEIALERIQRDIAANSWHQKCREFVLCVSWPLTPVSIKLNPSDNKISTSARKIIEKAERQLMQDRVRGINKRIENSDNNKARLAFLVTSIDLDRCGKFIDKVREERYNRVKARQVRKFQILFSKSKQTKDRNNNKNQNRSGQSANATRQGHTNNRLDHGRKSEANLERGKYNNK